MRFEMYFSVRKTVLGLGPDILLNHLRDPLDCYRLVRRYFLFTENMTRKRSHQNQPKKKSSVQHFKTSCKFEQPFLCEYHIKTAILLEFLTLFKMHAVLDRLDSSDTFGYFDRFADAGRGAYKTT